MRGKPDLNFLKDPDLGVNDCFTERPHKPAGKFRLGS